MQRVRHDLKRGNNPELLAALERVRTTSGSAKAARDQSRAQLTRLQRTHHDLILATGAIRARLRSQEQQRVAGLAFLVVGLAVVVTIAVGLERPPAWLVWVAGALNMAVVAFWAATHGRSRPEAPALEGYLAGAIVSAVGLGLAGWGSMVTLGFLGRQPVDELALWAGWPFGAVAVATWVLAAEPGHRARPGLVLAQIFGVLSLALLSISAFARIDHWHHLSRATLAAQTLAVAMGLMVLGQSGVLKERLMLPLERAGVSTRRFLTAATLAVVSAWFAEAALLHAAEATPVFTGCVRSGPDPLGFSPLLLSLVSAGVGYWFARQAPRVSAPMRWGPLVLSLATAAMVWGS